MTKHIHDPAVNDLETGMARRAFLGSSLLGGLGVALSLNTRALAGAPPDDRVAGECMRVTASDMLAMFSTLAWKLPLKLQKAVEAKDKERIVYGNFETHYKKLTELARQLKLTCSGLTQNDPRRNAASELADLTERNARAPRPGSVDGEAIYLHVSVLVAENRQLTRTANAMLPQTAADADDNKLICEMLAEIRAMESLKGNLDIARDDFDKAFKEFRTSVDALHTNIITASDEAAKADRGTGSKAAAIQKIEAAQTILDKMIAESTTEPSLVSPQTLKTLLEVSKNLLQTKPAVTQRLHSNDVQFRNASYTPGSNAPQSRFDQVYGILVECVWPSNPLSVGFLTGTCCAILDFYAQDPPRKDAIANALMSWWLSSASQCKDVAAKVAKVR